MFQKVSQKQLNNQTIDFIQNEAILVSPVNIKNPTDNGYFITCDSMYKNHQVIKAFNLMGNNYKNNIWQTENTEFPHYVKWINSTGKILINRYSIKMPLYFGEGYSQENIDTNIKSWTFQASDNGVDWNILDKVTLKENLGNGQFIIRKLENNIKYSWFRFVFNRNFSVKRNDISIGMIKCWNCIQK